LLILPQYEIIYLLLGTERCTSGT